MELFKKIKTANIDDKLAVLLLIGLSLFLLVAYALSAFRSFVNADAGYYLGVAELIHQGYVPYRDFQLSYTPLFFYVLQIPRIFMGEYPDYTGYMLFLYLMAFVDAFLLALIVRRATGSVKLAWASGLAFLVLYYYFEGAYFVLEAFSVCLGMVPILLLIGEKVGFWRAFLVGALSALSFLAKQYGLLFAGVIGIMLLFSNEEWKTRIRNCLGVLLGFCSIIALFFLLFFILGLKPDELIEALSGSSYGRQSAKLLFEGTARSVRLFPFLAFVPCLFLCKNQADRALVLGCLGGLAMAVLQFYFNDFSHYYIYMIPFVLVLNALLWKTLRNQKRSQLLLLLYFGLLFAAIAIPLQEVYKSSKTLVKHNNRESQLQTAKQLRQIAKDYDCKSALCYWNTIQYYGLCPLNPPMMNKYGYSFGYDTEDTYLERLRDADCFVVKSEDLENIREMKSFNRCLTNDFFLVENSLMGDTKVFVRNGN